MAIKIQTQDSYIPIEFGEHTFKFFVTDDSLTNLFEKGQEMEKKLDKIQPKNEVEEIEETKKILEEGFDLLLGEGSFKKVYAVSPSTVTCFQYYDQITTGIVQELQKRGLGSNPQQKAQKYLKKKKK